MREISWRLVRQFIHYATEHQNGIYFTLLDEIYFIIVELPGLQLDFHVYARSNVCVWCVSFVIMCFVPALLLL